MIEFSVEPAGNSSFIAKIVNKHKDYREDSVGAVYYVVIVIMIYACSIIMMIASHIRKNKMDRKLSAYLKEMAFVRKKERQMQLLNATNKLAAYRGTDGRVVKDARVALNKPVPEEMSLLKSPTNKQYNIVKFKDLDRLTPESCRKSSRKKGRQEMKSKSHHSQPYSTKVVIELNGETSDTETDV
ncbi:DgyrCDS8323 [Dimorphilus gyrociliatus]|nr:DgyrCDS8323 [Dimorphilus gyrociliatus]